jgi:type VI secretion system protein ImpA
MPDLLAPISASDPCGEDLSFSADFDLIQELRRQDDPTLDQGEWVIALKTADWSAVLARCETLLHERTKDLRLLAWRVEALAQLHGYAGLARGLDEVLRVCVAYWDRMHPRPEDGDLEQRAGAIRWLLVQTQRLARALPVTQGAGGCFTLTELDDARQLQLAIERDPDNAAALAHGKPTLAHMQRARRDTPADFLRANVNALAASRLHLQALQDLVDPVLGEQAPSFVHARQALDDAYHGIERLAREAGAAQDDAADLPLRNANEMPLTAVPVEATGRVAARPELHTRAQALQQLRGVADFFRRTEPHSPVALLAEKAARWGDMPLQAWLREVVKDGGSLAHLEELLGVRLPDTAAQ